MSSTVPQVLKGVLVLTGVAVSWAVSTQFTKSALSISHHFFAPYFIVWFNTCFMTLCYPVFLVYDCVYRRKSLVASYEESALVFSSKGLTLTSFLKRELPFITLWVMANYSYSRALGSISASAASSILSSNACIVCVLGWLLLHESFSIVKLSAVVMAVAGVVVISMDKKFGGELIGVALVVLCAFAAAFYKVLFKVVNGDATLGQVSMFMSGLGLINVTVNAIPAAVLYHLDIDHIEWAHVPWWPLIGTALLSMMFNFFVNFGIALLNPLVISVGMLVGLPLSAAIDILFRGMTLTVFFAIGTMLIVISFVLTAFPVEIIYRCWRVDDNNNKTVVGQSNDVVAASGTKTNDNINP